MSALAPEPVYIRGHNRMGMIRDLADRELTTKQIAEKYGKKHEAVRQFAKYNRAEIARIREEISARVTEPWAAKKVNRIADYDGCIERLEADFWDETLTWVASCSSR